MFRIEKEYPMYHDTHTNTMDNSIAEMLQIKLPVEIEDIAFLKTAMQYHRLNETFMDIYFGSGIRPFQQGISYGMSNRDGTISHPEVSYVGNSDGMRSIEYHKNARFLAVGCSHTYGLGLPVHLRWSDQLGKILQEEVLNLSYPGGSAMLIIQNLFQYFKKYGNPEYLLCLFPDFFRMIMPNNKYIMASNQYLELTHGNPVENLWVMPTNLIIENNKYLKLPVDPQSVISAEVSYYFNIQYIKMLIQYCISSGIKLIWTSWANKLMYVLDELSSRDQESYYGFKNFKLPELFWKKSEDFKCHKDLLAEEEYFYHAQDFSDEIPMYPHWGSHMHAHIAELFKKEIDNYVKN